MEFVNFQFLILVRVSPLLNFNSWICTYSATCQKIWKILESEHVSLHYDALCQKGKKQIVDMFAKGEGEKEVWIETHFPVSIHTGF